MDQTGLFCFVLGTGLAAVLFVHESGHLLAARYRGEMRDMSGSPTGPIWLAAGLLVSSLLLLNAFRALERSALTAVLNDLLRAMMVRRQGNPVKLM